MRSSVLYGILAGSMMFFVSCADNKKEDTRDTPVKGVINISVDESFKPVIEEQITHLFRIRRSMFLTNQKQPVSGICNLIVRG
jgi:hypothetical protein